MIEINPRRISLRKPEIRVLKGYDFGPLTTSIRQVGMVNAITCHLHKGKLRVADGNLRLKVARKLKLKKVPVVLWDALVLEPFVGRPVSEWRPYHIWKALETMSLNEISIRLGVEITKIKRACYQ